MKEKTNVEIAAEALLSMEYDVHDPMRTAKIIVDRYRRQAQKLHDLGLLVTPPQEENP